MTVCWDVEMISEMIFPEVANEVMLIEVLMTAFDEIARTASDAETIWCTDDFLMP